MGVPASCALGADVAVAVGQALRQQVVGLGVARDGDVVGDRERVDEPHREREKRHGQEKSGEPAGRALAAIRRVGTRRLRRSGGSTRANVGGGRRCPVCLRRQYDRSP